MPVSRQNKCFASGQGNVKTGVDAVNKRSWGGRPALVEVTFSNSPQGDVVLDWRASGVE
jgi:hypothetical protein